MISPYFENFTEILCGTLIEIEQVFVARSDHVLGLARSVRSPWFNRVVIVVVQQRVISGHAVLISGASVSIRVCLGRDLAATLPIGTAPMCRHYLLGSRVG